MKISVADESAMLALAWKFAGLLPSDHGLMVYLQGDLGAGKTTFCRGVLRGLGVDSIVRSPTYTLVESYQTERAMVHHFDLYRLVDPEELEYIGGRDYFSAQAICFVEWPLRGGGYLPPADIVIELERLPNGRIFHGHGKTAFGKDFIERFQNEVV